MPGTLENIVVPGRVGRNMARETVRDKLVYWKSQIRRGISYQQKFGESKKWKDYHDYYYGKYKTDVYAVNKVFSILRSSVPRIYFRNPKVLVSPTRPELEERAFVVQAVDNLLIKQMMMKDTTKKLIQDAFFCNRGIGKIGYDTQYGSVPDYIMKEAPGEEAIEYDVTVKPGMPWVLRANPEHFIVPWGVASLKDTPWVAHRVVRLLSDVKKDPIYENTGKLKGGLVRELRGMKDKEAGLSDTIKSSQDEAIKEYASADEEWVELWELRDLKRKHILTLNLDYDKFLRRPVSDELQTDGAPFEDICFNPDNDVYWGPSDMRILEPLQIELNETRTQMSEHRKINVLKLLINASKMTPEEAQKLMNGEVGGIALINELAQGDVFPLQIGEPVQLRADAMDIEKDIRETVGFSRLAEGAESVAPRKTKFEVQEMGQGHWIRIDERRDIVADFLVRTLEKVNRIIFAKWDTARVVPLVGSDAALHWVRFTGRELEGEYDLSVDVDTGRPVTTETKRSEAWELLERLGSSEILLQHLNIRELLRNVLKLYDWIDTDRVMPAQEAQGGPMAPQIEGMEQFAQGLRGGR